MAFDPCTYRGVLWGLGNPGPAYAGTRHNLGAMAVEALAFKSGELKPGLKVARSWELRLEGSVWLLAANLIYMNESGAVAEALAENGFKPSQVLVLVDDLDLPFGSLRLRESGSPGNHNGLKSIQSVWGDEVPRLRMGISPSALEGGSVDGEAWKPFVLSRFSGEEEKELPGFLNDAGQAARTYFLNGLTQAGNTWNRRGLRKTSA